MKKLITLTLALVAGFTITKAQTFSDDFETYTVGSKLGPQSADWTVWSGATGENGTTDPDVANTDNHTTGGAKSIYFSSTSATGGPVDCVLPFGGSVLNTGQFSFTAWFKVPSTKTAYFNFQGTLPPYTGVTMYTLDCWLNADGSLLIANSGTPVITTTHPVGSWFELTINANLNTNSWDLVIDGITMGTWANAINQVGGIDIYPADANASFWVDDVSYNIVPYTLLPLNGAVTNVSVTNGLVTQQRTATAIVRNLGTTAITSFDLNMVANGTPSNQSVTGVNIASLATYTVTATAPSTLIAGVNTFSATISNVNGLGADGDANDDTKTFTITPVQAATGKVVVAEEATGCWCQWCPRGAVYMESMATKYDGYFAGIAVHNNDVITDSAYNAFIAPQVPGFPSALVDRLPALDPSAMEPDFLTRVQIAPKAFITNSETYNIGTRALDVTITTTFQQAVSGDYRLACVLTEDDVHGTTSAYNQSNAYAGGGSGVMGGFETLPNPVPAAQMYYDHVARTISPDPTGIPNNYGASTTVGQVFTNTFNYVLPAAWNPAKIHIIGLFIDPTGLIDNASTSMISEAQQIGIAEMAGNNNEVTLYPNPSGNNSTIYLNLQKEASVQVAIYNVTGELVAKKEYGKLTGGMILPIESSQFSSGLYFVNVTIDGKLTTKKLVKQ